VKRTPFLQMEWRDRPVTELSRSELLELCEVLHGMVWDSAENFDRLHAFNRDVMAQCGGGLA
jgi:hypothetical protein